MDFSLDKRVIETREINPYERLLAAVIEQAIKDGCEKSYYFEKVKRESAGKSQSKYMRILRTNHRQQNARDWFNDDSSTLKHFCSTMGMNFKYVRKIANQIFNEVDEKRLPRH